MAAARKNDSHDVPSTMREVAFPIKLVRTDLDANGLKINQCTTVLPVRFRMSLSR
jgi:hypothetical protein